MVGWAVPQTDGHVFNQREGGGILFIFLLFQINFFLGYINYRY